MITHLDAVSLGYAAGLVILAGTFYFTVKFRQDGARKRRHDQYLKQMEHNRQRQKMSRTDELDIFND